MILSQECYRLYLAGIVMFRVYICKTRIIERFIGTSCICLPGIGLFHQPSSHFLTVKNELIQSVSFWEFQ